MSTLLKTNGKEMTLERVYDAPRALVFEVWTNADHIVHWWGPEGFTTTGGKMNVVPGGSWDFTLHGPDGTNYPNRIIFLEVVKPEKLVYKHSGDDDTEPVTFHVTVLFEEMGPKKTRLVMNSVFASAEELERVNREYHAAEGGRQMMQRLASYLDRQ